VVVALVAIGAAVLGYPLVWRKARATLQRAPLLLVIAVRGSVWLAAAVGVVVGIMQADSCYRCNEWDLLIEVGGSAVLAALLTAAGLIAVLLLGWALWRAAGVVATDPRAAVFAVFIVVVLALAVVLIAVLT